MIDVVESFKSYSSIIENYKYNIYQISIRETYFLFLFFFYLLSRDVQVWYGYILWHYN